ncbi:MULTISPECIES: TetR/AcrR family transcriptional regulator [Oerskovia]|uniref:TetR family transcriptional regulator n=1 Tax=Oerskovia rustica TaxID=2762237 RepID=A0ABR8RVW7_9CELL|nr:TetR/AcrR family transcriptional regulator [Oerskovia rustica]MBD7951925.1 TetR family transcriptional regulator [Oerskovia rustica]
MTRPRTVTDDDLLDRIDRALSNRSTAGPWTLHEVAPAAGISPAGLIKRFGSKADLLHALARRWTDLVPSAPSGSRPADELRAYVSAEFGAPSAGAAIFALDELLTDLRTPESIALLREGWDKQTRYLEQLLTAMPLPRLADPRRGALLLLDALHGSLYRQGIDLDAAPPTDTLDQLLEAWT